MKDLQKLFIQYQKAVISVGILLFSVIALFVGVIPSFKTTIALFHENKTLQDEVSALALKTDSLHSMSEEDLRSKLTLATSAVPSDKQIPSLFDAIEILVSRSKVSLEDLSLDSNQAISSDSAKRQVKEDKTIGAPLIGFTVMLKGGYADLRSFLSEIVSVRRFFRVRFFDLTFQNESSGQMRVGADAFYFPLPTTIPGVAAKLQLLSGDDEDLLKKISVYPWLAETVSAPLTPTVYEPKVNPFGQ
ncbi:type 4a pilus biogenesis protein PilO [Candidatus Gottesmanbacteria bacterium]|nr:type 4a pilus biogenesis protein PilO [Candidatus Gottesmanbacteria bacterium]